MDAVGQTTAVSLNSVHYAARVVHKIDVTISPTGFSFKLRFGFKSPAEDPLDSEWEYCLARSVPDNVTPEQPEPFLDTLRRAVDKYEFIMNPNNSHLTKKWFPDDEGPEFVPKKALTDTADVAWT